MRAADIKKKLEMLQAIGTVNVTFTDQVRDMACNDPMPGSDPPESVHSLDYDPENNNLNYNITLLRIQQGQNLSNSSLNTTDFYYPEPNYIIVEFVSDHFYNYTPYIGNLARVVMDPSLPTLEPMIDHLHNITFWDAGRRRDEVKYGNATFLVRSKGETFKRCSNLHLQTGGFSPFEETDCHENWTYPEYISVTGTRQWLECSGRGTCNHEIGECTCFKGYSSSDGFYNKGRRRDCGYISRFDSAF